jgi:hypothetical protein
VHTISPDEKSVFVVVTTEFFQNTFAGMLQWESVMADDLKFLIFPDDVRGVANTANQPSSGISSSTASTSGRAPLFTIRGTFEDRIVKNKDVRVFKSDNGQVLFLYSFVDNNKLVITDKEATLAEILTRLEKAASIR